MRDPGRVAAAIDILEAFRTRPLPLSTLIADWGRGARYAGSKDRAFVRGLCLDALRRWETFGGKDSARLAVLLTLRESWSWPQERIAEAFAGEHGPGALTDDDQNAAPGEGLDFPEWLAAQIDDPAAASASMADRAPVDLRVNTLKADQDKALRALKTLRAEPSPLSPIGLRIAPPAAAEKGPGVTVIPAYGKGWVEVQDEGSQLTALASGAQRGNQVLDLCAGGGGKTLALSAMLANTGQVFAHDIDAKRLAPIHERLRRAGARNVQVVPPNEPERLTALAGKMDCVFIDAPCSGAGTWRRHPDAKWRLTEKHLEERLAEQDQVLREAAAYMKPGGTLVYVTCSFLKAENEDRVAAFIDEVKGFEIIDPLDGADETLSETLSPFVSGHALRLTPWTSSTDGFTLIKLRHIDS
ncbi:MAG: RsmB/NOP family class I SAM-dependent RNA methyltransferase [Pseudomonadota bacterium]